jgi:hypothetical protein
MRDTTTSIFNMCETQIPKASGQKAGDNSLAHTPISHIALDFRTESPNLDNPADGEAKILLNSF